MVWLIAVVVYLAFVGVVVFAGHYMLAPHRLTFQNVVGTFLVTAMLAPVVALALGLAGLIERVSELAEAFTDFEDYHEPGTTKESR